jgi:alpha-L-fucosidase
MDLARYWESCIHVGKGWSYRGEEGFKTPDDCIRMLVSCTTGGGNLLLNFGPRPDGTITDAETTVAKKTGEWLAKYGESIYGTRGGPYKNGQWGGSCHKGTKLFLHIYQLPENGVIGFDPLPKKILSARTLDGAPVEFRQGANELSLTVPKEGQASPVTVVELTMDSPIPEGTIYGHAHVASNNLAEFGRDLTANATISTSSVSEQDDPAQRASLLRGERSPSGYAFHTEAEENPWLVIDLGENKMVNAVVIENTPRDRRAEGLMMSISKDGKTWETVWKALAWQDKWIATLTRFHAGINIPGRQARYIRLETKDVSPRPLLLQRVNILGQ